MNHLPPLSARLMNWPASAWLGVGRGRCAHCFAAGYSTSACGLTAPARAVRLTWLGWAAPSYPRCRTCARRLGVE